MLHPHTSSMLLQGAAALAVLETQGKQRAGCCCSHHTGWPAENRACLVPCLLSPLDVPVQVACWLEASWPAAAAADATQATAAAATLPVYRVAATAAAASAMVTARAAVHQFVATMR
jgi:hypothetical protein